MVFKINEVKGQPKPHLLVSKNISIYVPSYMIEKYRCIICHFNQLEITYHIAWIWPGHAQDVARIC